MNQYLIQSGANKEIRFLSVVLAMLVGLMGNIVIFGWFSHNEILIQVNPSFAPMQFNTALGFVLASLGVLTLFSDKKAITNALGAGVALLGGLTLLQYIFGGNFGIDELIIEHYIDQHVSHPGRMAPSTAFCFLITGATLLLAVYRPSIKTEAVLASIVLSLSSVAFIGYLIGIDTSVDWQNLTKMAIHTSIAFILLSLVIWARAYLKAHDSQTNSHRWMVLPIAITGLSISSMLWQTLSTRHLQTKSGDQLLVATYAGEGILIFGISLTVLICYSLWSKSNTNNFKSNKITVFSTVYLGALLSFSVFQYSEDEAQQDILQDFNELITQLKPLIDDYDTEAAETAELLYESLIDSQYTEQVKSLVEAVDNYDFDNAAELLTAIASSLEQEM